MRKKVYVLGMVLIASMLFNACGKQTVQSQTVDNLEVAAAMDAQVPATLEESAVEEIDEETAYQRFLGFDESKGMVAAVDPGLTVGFAREITKTDDSVVLEDLKSKICVDADGNPVETTIYYGMYKGGKRPQMAMYFDAKPDNIEDNVLLFCYYDEQLHLSYSYYAKDISTVGLHKSGYVYAEKLIMDGDFLASRFYVDAAGKIRLIYSEEHYDGTLIGDMTDLKVYKKAYKKTEPSIQLVTYDFEDVKYHSYNLVEGATLSEADQKFMVDTSEMSMIWLIPDEINVKISERVETLNLDDKFFDSQSVEWIEL